MEPHIKARFTPQVEAAVAAAVGRGPLARLGGFESIVLRCPDAPVIVKATWSGRRSVDEVGAELHFVNHLADHGAPVCRALPLAGGGLVGVVDAEGGAFHVSAFAEAPGGPLSREGWTEQTFARWGEAAGMLHRLSAAYPGPPPPLHRPGWEEELAALTPFIGDVRVEERWHALLAEIRALPQDGASFGPMHTDLHQHNLHWHDGRPHIFDFEDMLDFWFVADLSIILYYAMMRPIWTDNLQADFVRAHGALMEGYHRQHTLPPASRAALPLFMQLREHALRAVSLRSVPEERRTERWWRYINGATDRIVSGAPPQGLDLAALGY